MKAMLRDVVAKDAAGEEHHYQAVMYWCPAVYPPLHPDDDPERGHKCGLHMLPVSGDAMGKPMWTLHNVDPLHIEPSVLSYGPNEHRCHSFVRNGHVEFLGDSTHSLAGQTVPLADFPDWLIAEGEGGHE